MRFWTCCQPLSLGGGVLQHLVHDFVELLETYGCSVEHGPMSSIVKG